MSFPRGHGKMSWLGAIRDASSLDYDDCLQDIDEGSILKQCNPLSLPPLSRTIMNNGNTINHHDCLPAKLVVSFAHFARGTNQ